MSKYTGVHGLMFKKVERTVNKVIDEIDYNRVGRRVSDLGRSTTYYDTGKSNKEEYFQKLNKEEAFRNSEVGKRLEAQAVEFTSKLIQKVDPKEPVVVKKSACSRVLSIFTGSK